MLFAILVLRLECPPCPRQAALLLPVECMDRPTRAEPPEQNLRLKTWVNARSWGGSLVHSPFHFVLGVQFELEWNFSSLIGAPDEKDLGADRAIFQLLSKDQFPNSGISRAPFSTTAIYRNHTERRPFAGCTSMKGAWLCFAT